MLPAFQASPARVVTTPSAEIFRIVRFSVSATYTVPDESTATPRGKLNPAAVPALVLLALVLLFSRVYLGVHYLGDVLGGVAYGLIWCAALAPAGARPRRAQ